jgi:hypothetical protein
MAEPTDRPPAGQRPEEEAESDAAVAPPSVAQPSAVDMARRLDSQMLTPRAPLPPGAGIRVYPIPMGPTPVSAAPAAWAPDPTGRHQWRWWSGAVWTDHVADDGEVGEDPLDPDRDG